MKCDMLNGILTFVLGVLVVLGVIMAMRMAMLTHELRTWQNQAAIRQAIMMQTTSVYNAAAAYNQRYNDPRLSQILSTVVQPKSVKR